jgi:cytochrome P450
VLSLLCEARDEAGRGLDDRELRDELVTLLVAGHETTATALAWAFERLATSPEVRARLEEEVARVVGEGPLEAEHLPALGYLDAVIRETLRLRPVVPLVGRVAVQPIDIGPYRIPPGVRTLGLLSFTHRRADIWPEPDRFLPDRFLGRQPAAYEWLPFGGGVRRCLGMAFALYEMKVVLATVLARARIAAASDRETAVVRRHITLAPADGGRIVLRELDGGCGGRA